ncbi:MAG: WhiB family transcriptional regulator [Mycobacteriales bacterium]
MLNGVRVESLGGPEFTGGAPAAGESAVSAGRACGTSSLDDADEVRAALTLLDEEAEQEWQERALCAQTDPEAFFPEKGGSTREAKKICTGCEVRSECLEYALAHDERFGIWGGLSERERRRFKRRVI